MVRAARLELTRARRRGLNSLWLPLHHARIILVYLFDLEGSFCNLRVRYNIAHNDSPAFYKNYTYRVLLVLKSEYWFLICGKPGIVVGISPTLLAF